MSVLANLDKLKGNEKVKEQLKNIFSAEVKPQSFLIHGPSTYGETLLADIITEEYDFDQFNYSLVNLLSCNSKTSFKNLVAEIVTEPNHDKWNIYLIDECQCYTKEVQGILAEGLTKLPERVLVIIEVSDLTNLDESLISACQYVLEIEKLN